MGESTSCKQETKAMILGLVSLRTRWKKVAHTESKARISSTTSKC